MSQNYNQSHGNAPTNGTFVGEFLRSGEDGQYKKELDYKTIEYIHFNFKSIKMEDILVVGKLKEGKFEKFMGFMQSEQGMNERRKIADLTKTLGTVSPDKRAVMFKIAVHNQDALN